MPTRPFTVRELDDAELLAEVAMALDDDDSSDDDLFDSLVCAACEPLLKDFNQEVGPERLSVARLQREAAAQGLDGDTASRNVYNDYRFRLEDLPRVIAALDPPARFSTNSRATFSGEEGVLLMLRRLRSTAPLLDLVKESGRSITQISEAVRFMIEHVHSHHSHLIDERAFIAWEHRFADFAAALRNTGVARTAQPNRLHRWQAAVRLQAWQVSTRPLLGAQARARHQIPGHRLPEWHPTFPVRPHQRQSP